MSGTVLIAVAVVVAVVLLLIVLLAVRSRSAAPRALTGPAAPSSPTAIVCSFCRREYEPAQTAGRCPGCGAAAPR